MARRCDICGKSPQTAMHVSHSHRRTKTRKQPNLQKVGILLNGSPRKARVCTACLKANKVQRAA